MREFPKELGGHLAEFTLRRIHEPDLPPQQLVIANGWIVFSINLQKLLLDRVRAQGEEWVRRVIAMERKTASVAADRGLTFRKTSSDVVAISRS